MLYWTPWLMLQKPSQKSHEPTQQDGRVIGYGPKALHYHREYIATPHCGFDRLSCEYVPSLDY